MNDIENKVLETEPAANEAAKTIDENDFMASIEASMRRIHTGQTVTGTVVQVTDDEVCVNIGYKSDGLIKRSDLVDQDVKIGDEIEVKVSEIDSQGRVNLIRNDITYPTANEGGSRSGNGGRGNRPPRRDGRPFGGGNDRT